MNPIREAEKKFRAKLGRHPVIYAFVGGVGVVLFWRGVWHSVDFLALTFMSHSDGVTSIDWPQGVDSLISLALGVILLLSTGLFVVQLLGGETAVSNIKKEERMVEKTEGEVKKESAELPHIEEEIHEIADKLERIEEDLRQNQIKGRES